MISLLTAVIGNKLGFNHWEEKYMPKEDDSESPISKLPVIMTFLDNMWNLIKLDPLLNALGTNIGALYKAIATMADKRTSFVPRFGDHGVGSLCNLITHMGVTVNFDKKLFWTILLNEDRSIDSDNIYLFTNFQNWTENTADGAEKLMKQIFTEFGMVGLRVGIDFDDQYTLQNFEDLEQIFQSQTISAVDQIDRSKYIQPLRVPVRKTKAQESSAALTPAQFVASSPASQAALAAAAGAGAADAEFGMEDVAPPPSFKEDEEDEEGEEDSFWDES
jgi:hypothetical protein